MITILLLSAVIAGLIAAVTVLILKLRNNQKMYDVLYRKHTDCESQLKTAKKVCNDRLNQIDKMRKSVITIYDEAPTPNPADKEERYRRRCIMKLQNELLKAEVVQVNGNKVFIKCLLPNTNFFG